MNGSPSAAGPPQTFEQQKPTGETPLKPIPNVEAQPNSMPGPPRLIDPDNRTTTRPMFPTPQIHLVASPPRFVPIRPAASDDDGWRASAD